MHITRQTSNNVMPQAQHLRIRITPVICKAYAVHAWNAHYCRYAAKLARISGYFYYLLANTGLTGLLASPLWVNAHFTAKNSQHPYRSVHYSLLLRELNRDLDDMARNTWCFALEKLRSFLSFEGLNSFPVSGPHPHLWTISVDDSDPRG